MKRNKDLIRAILLDIESRNEEIYYSNHPANTDYVSKIFTENSEAEVFYHLKLLVDDGFLLGDCPQFSIYHIPGVIISSITMKGHDYIDKIRDKGIWEEVKNELGVVGDSWDMKTITLLATKILKKRLGL